MISNSDNETIEIAKNFAATLNGGEVICLHGNLGAGKTTFMKGVVEYFNIDKDEIISPTFIIANQLKSQKPKDKNQNIENIIHIDAYRIENEDNMLETGVLEYFGDKNSIVFIEWSEKIKKYIPENNVKNIYFDIIENNKRDINILSRV
ncbi:MAG: tRNA (adenosine(37)-N6)-threonylcarbamoyltransferase complex ATPase subunit type 1 TsaE [Patescibacteria group bacterium]